MAPPVGPILMIVRRVLRLVSREQRRRTRAAGRAPQQGSGGTTPPQGG